MRSIAVANCGLMAEQYRGNYGVGGVPRILQLRVRSVAGHLTWVTM